MINRQAPKLTAIALCILIGFVPDKISAIGIGGGDRLFSEVCLELVCEGHSSRDAKTKSGIGVHLEVSSGVNQNRLGGPTFTQPATSHIGMASFAYLSDPEVTDRRGMGRSIFWSMLIGFEIVVLAGSLVSRYETGAYLVGGFYGLTSLGTLPGVIDGQYELLVFTIGTAALSWYNLRYAAEHSPSRKFYTNLIGANVMAAGYLLSALIPQWFSGFSDSGISLVAGAGEVGFQVGL